MGGGEQVSAVAALFRNGSALSVCREICWRLSASAGGERGGGEGEGEGAALSQSASGSGRDAGGIPAVTHAGCSW